MLCKTGIPINTERVVDTHYLLRSLWIGQHFRVAPTNDNWAKTLTSIDDSFPINNVLLTSRLHIGHYFLLSPASNGKLQIKIDKNQSIMPFEPIMFLCDETCPSLIIVALSQFKRLTLDKIHNTNKYWLGSRYR